MINNYCGLITDQFYESCVFAVNESQRIKVQLISQNRT